MHTFYAVSRAIGWTYIIAAVIGWVRRRRCEKIEVVSICLRSAARCRTRCSAVSSYLKKYATLFCIKNFCAALRCVALRKAEKRALSLNCWRQHIPARLVSDNWGFRRRLRPILMASILTGSRWNIALQHPYCLHDRLCRVRHPSRPPITCSQYNIFINNFIHGMKR